MAGRAATSVLMAIALAAAAAAHADPKAPPPPIDLIPLVGVRGGADLESSTTGVPKATAGPSLSLGLAVDVFLRPDAWFEVFVDHQLLHFTSQPSAFGTGDFDLAVDYLQFGGGYGPAEGAVRPYVTASVGLTRYGASSADLDSTIGISGSLGGGMRIPVGRRVALRFELRGYGTIQDAAVAVTCGPGCFVRFSGDGWYQLAGTFGVAIRL